MDILDIDWSKSYISVFMDFNENHNILESLKLHEREGRICQNLGANIYVVLCINIFLACNKSRSKSRKYIYDTELNWYK